MPRTEPESFASVQFEEVVAVLPVRRGPDAGALGHPELVAQHDVRTLAYDGTVSDRRSQLLLDGSVIQLYDVSCRAQRAAPGEDEHSVITEVILPLRGCFEVERGQDRTVADATSVVVLGAGHDYRVGHPVSGGDECFVFAVPSGIEDDVMQGAGEAALLDPTVRLRAHRARAALRSGNQDPLEAEERGLELLRAVVRSFPDRAGSGRAPGRAQRMTVERVRALLASRPMAPWRLDTIAREVFVSPAHLARQFRAVTGESISRYLLRLRLGLALDRLADGESDLAALAVELGFAHHSHFTARFRQTFGVTPSAARRSLTSARLAELRTFVTAPDRAAS